MALRRVNSVSGTKLSDGSVPRVSRPVGLLIGTLVIAGFTLLYALRAALSERLASDGSNYDRFVNNISADDVNTAAGKIQRRSRMIRTVFGSANRPLHGHRRPAYTRTGCNRVRRDNNEKSSDSQRAVTKVIETRDRTCCLPWKR